MTANEMLKVFCDFLSRLKDDSRGKKTFVIEFSSDSFVRSIGGPSRQSVSDIDGSKNIPSLPLQAERETRRKSMAGIKNFAELDLLKIQNALNQILADRKIEGAFVWKLFREFCIYKVPSEDKLYKATYTVSGMNVALSEKPVEVREQIEFVPVKPVQFNDSPGIVLDQDSVKFSEAARQLSMEKKISLGAAMSELRSEGWKPDGPSDFTFNATPGINLDQDSVEICRSARKISTDRNITFGEALSEMRK